MSDPVLILAIALAANTTAWIVCRTAVRRYNRRRQLWFLTHTLRDKLRDRSILPSSLVMICTDKPSALRGGDDAVSHRVGHRVRKPDANRIDARPVFEIHAIQPLASPRLRRESS